MTITERVFELKDGRTALLCSPREEDAQEMLDYLYVSSGETVFVLRYPEECGKYTLEGEKELFAKMNASENEAMILCRVDEKIAGSCYIGWNEGLKTRHRASVAVALLREYWNQGIGTEMFREMVRIAEENPQVIQLELDFIEGNARARALYEKLGFRITGVKPDAVRLKDGTLLNEYSMMRKIR